MLDTNTFIFICVAIAFGTVGTVVWIADSGISDKYKSLLMVLVGSITVALIGLFFMIEDNSEFEYSGYEKMKRGKNGGQQRTSMVEEGGAGDQAQQTGSDDGGGSDPGQGATSFKDCPDCPEMVMIPAGLALLGSTHQMTSGGLTSAPTAEKPFHNPFAIGKYEITVGEFLTFVKAMNYKPSGKCRRGDGSSGEISYLSPRFPQTPLHPVVCVNWIDATSYASWLSGETGRTYRLPTEAEWEYAARAGITRPYINGERLNARAANFRVRIGKQNSGTKKVGSYGSNGNGMFDVHGNVWEFVTDCWSQFYQVATVDNTNANNPHDCTRRIVKGGSWSSPQKQTAFPMRGAIPKTASTDAIGFRVMREEPEPDPTPPDVVPTKTQ